MAEIEGFESRLQAALEAYADEVPTTVDAAGLTQAIAASKRRRGWRRLFPAQALGAWSGTFRIARLGLALCALVLLTAALVVLAQRIAPRSYSGLLTGRMVCVGPSWTGGDGAVSLDCEVDLADARAGGPTHITLGAAASAGDLRVRSGRIDIRTERGGWSAALRSLEANNGVAVADLTLDGWGGCAGLVLHLHVVTADGLQWGLFGEMESAP